MEIFHFARTRAHRALWVSEELGINIDINTVDLPSGAQKKPDYLAIHPLGMVPAIKDGDETLFESAAIVLTLADRHSEAGLAPALDSPLRGKYNQWSVFGPAELDHILATISLHTFLLPEEMRNPDIAAAARDQFLLRAKVLNDELSSKPYLLGDKFQACDIIVGHDCAWATLVNLLSDFPSLESYLQRLSERPAYEKAYGQVYAS